MSDTKMNRNAVLSCGRIWKPQEFALLSANTPEGQNPVGIGKQLKYHEIEGIQLARLIGDFEVKH